MLENREQEDNSSETSQPESGDYLHVTILWIRDVRKDRHPRNTKKRSSLAKMTHERYIMRIDMQKDSGFTKDSKRIPDEAERVLLLIVMCHLQKKTFPSSLLTTQTLQPCKN